MPECSRKIVEVDAYFELVDVVLQSSEARAISPTMAQSNVLRLGNIFPLTQADRRIFTTADIEYSGRKLESRIK